MTQQDGIRINKERKDSGKPGHWWDYPRFKGPGLTVLLMGATHLLLREIQNALLRLGHRAAVVLVEKKATGRFEAIKKMTAFLNEIRPDFVLTINHSGFDREGAFTDLLNRFRIPFASWYVDSPHLILHHYQDNRSDFLFLFTWDADYVELLEKRGFHHVVYLPLGVDESVFHPEAGTAPNQMPGQINLGFVGNSMAVKVASILRRNRIHSPLLDRMPFVASAYEKDKGHIVRHVLSEHFPDLMPLFDQLSPDVQMAYETAIIWQATGTYRLNRIKALKRFSPVIAGDPGWKSLLDSSFRVMSELNYYSQLPLFYSACRINFNATSRQMKNGVNQRVFDVPACRHLLLTDHTRQLEQVLDPGKEVLVYQTPSEIPELVERILADEDMRKSIAKAGYARVMAEHTYMQRMETLIGHMRKTFG